MSAKGLGWWMAVLLLALLAVAAPAKSQAEAADGQVEVCLRRAAASDPDGRAILRQPNGFDCRTPQTAWGPGDYWAISRPIVERRVGKTLLVRNSAVWQMRTTVWARYADAAVLRLVPARSTSSIGTGIVHLIPARVMPPVQLLWRVEGAGNTRGVVVGARIATLAEHADANTGASIMVGWFAGLCVGFLFLNIMLWLALRHQFQLAYCAMVGSLLLYVAADAGLVRRGLYDFGPTADLKMSSLTFTLCIVGAIWFARSFLEPAIVGVRLKRFIQAAAAAMIVSALVQALLPPWQMLWIDKVQATTFLLALAGLGALTWRAWAARSAMRWVWSATIVVPALLAAMRVANSFPDLGTLFSMGDTMMAMMAAGMFASSLAIAFRVHLTARERDEARGQEIAARLLADTDPLTGMLNRRAFLAQAIGRESEQVLMLADIDHFKRVNETIGHDGGDEVLRAVARALETAVPDGVLVARIGGEEFAILAPAALPLDPAAILDHIRAARMPYDVAVTASIGICTGPLTQETDWKAMYHDADRALFAAKSAGRDRARRAAARARPLAVAA